MIVLVVLLGWVLVSIPAAFIGGAVCRASALPVPRPTRLSRDLTPVWVTVPAARRPLLERR